MTFDEYLISKKIDAAAFEKAEPELFQSWKSDFDQMHVNSFTIQKLNLINPIRRKYQLREKSETGGKQDSNPASTPGTPNTPSPARIVRPVYKPKIN